MRYYLCQGFISGHLAQEVVWRKTAFTILIGAIKQEMLINWLSFIQVQRFTHCAKQII